MSHRGGGGGGGENTEFLLSRAGLCFTCDGWLELHVTKFDIGYNLYYMPVLRISFSLSEAIPKAYMYFLRDSK